MRAATLLCLAWLAGCAAQPADDACGLVLGAELPLAMIGLTPMLTVQIAGQNATMILDTGAQQTLLTAPAIARLGLRSDARQVTTITGVGGSSRNFPAVITGFNVGRLRFPDQHALALPGDLPRVNGVVVDGLLGVDVLGHFEVDLDLPRNRLALYGGPPCDGEALPLDGPSVALPGTLLRRNRLLAQVVLDDVPLLALLDTGAVNTIVSSAVLPRLGIAPETVAGEPHASLRGVGPNAQEATIHRFTSLTIAGQRFDRPQLRITDLRAADGTAALFGDGGASEMILGPDYLARHRLWLAYPRQKVFLQRAPGSLARQ